MAADEPLRYRRLRAPLEDQAALIEPPLAEIPLLVVRNQKLAKDWDRLSGVSFSTLQKGERSGLVGEPAGRSTLGQPIIASGHQPTLYHPGVWLKNFLLSRVAERVDGVAVNLTVDNDAIRNPSIRVPVGTLESPRVEDIVFDAAAEEIPWEERQILDRSTFDNFAARMLAAYAPLREASSWRAKPLLIEHLWHHARRLADSRQVGLCNILVSARAAVEKSHGLKIKEYEISKVCRSTTWYEFLNIIFQRTAELHSVYNSALAEYRAVNHIHNRLHPVPDLSCEDEWLEMPFWIWHADAPRRQRLFVRGTSKSWEVRNNGGDLRLSAGEVLQRAIRSPEIRIRPKALITTMYARLVLSDLFIHGIGGAKYDEVTDAIIRRFFNIEPPGYVTATATVRLPLERPQVTPDDLILLDQKYRDTIHHPEQFADENSGPHRAEFAALVKQKQELIAHRWQDKQKKVWHDQVRSTNERMSALLDPLREQLRSNREQLLADLHRARILGSREYSFCLFPEEMLVPLLKKMAGIQS
jgi:hypothetical protein